MGRFKNYVGQFRLYSLAELVLIMHVVGADAAHLAGAVLLWSGSNAALESMHEDKGREKMPKAAAILLCVVGLYFFGVWQGLPFVVAGIVYAWKKQGWWGLVSPLVRGFQMFTLLLPFWPLGAAVFMGFVLAIRNYFGDRRDVEEDRSEGIITWPVYMGQEKDEPFGHLIATFATTLMWWGFGHLSWWWAAGFVFFQTATYWLTPRESNKNAGKRWREALRDIRGQGGR